jgi:hypothetical protein
MTNTRKAYEGRLAARLVLAQRGNDEAKMKRQELRAASALAWRVHKAGSGCGINFADKN